jgi:single-strand DNA-binding protein
MFDTYVTVVGNVLTAPEWRRTTNTGTLVAKFKVASTARRLDRENDRWIDGNSLRVRVTCWRKLAEGVASSLMTGDPVIVVGRLYTRDWVDADGNNRTMYELEAAAVGHDLARGRGKFARNRPTTSTSALEDDEAELRAGGEATEVVGAADAPARPGDNDGVFDDGDPGFGDLPAFSGAGQGSGGDDLPGVPDDARALVGASSPVVASAAADEGLSSVDGPGDPPSRGGRRSRAREPQPV